MVFNQLPDPRLFNSTSHRNTESAVIYAATYGKYHYPDHITPYLLVANFKNIGNYWVNSQATFINSQFFYFLSAGEHLEINFERKEPLETMLVLFSEQLINGVAGYHCETVDNLLDNYDETKSRDFHMPTIPLAYNAMVIRYLNHLKCNRGEEDQDSILFHLLDAIWALSQNAKAGLARISAQRKSTREELYRRLFLAELYIRDNFCEPLAIDKIAKEACMNKFHFLKLFKHRYGVSPHQYLVRLKLEHARRLLDRKSTRL